MSIATIAVAAAVAFAVSMVRWVRVAQREHYLPGSTSRFALRWWTVKPINVAAIVVAVVGIVLTLWAPLWGLVPAAVCIAGPVGLGLRGRTSQLVWTDRARRVAVVSVAIGAGVAAGSRAVIVIAVVPVVTPVIVDIALGILAPIERALSRRFVEEATRRLKATDPTIVAITGSFGKTTTKGYVGHLLRRTADVVVSPASFNNRLGLARSINEHVTSGTHVFVAEMGTYGPGEIRELCGWITPTVSVITAIGPVHLERFGSLEAIAAAKSEIVDDAHTLVLNVDYPSLEDLGAREASTRTVIRCSSRDPQADVYAAEEGSVYVHGTRVGTVNDPDVFSGNVACAVGVALALGVTPEPEDFDALSRPPHRLQAAATDAGVIVLDDTYNANPSGADGALDALVRHGTGRRVVVTPGMVELGRRQFEENERFAERASRVANDIVIVGRTNRKALREGASSGSASIIVVDSRDEAVAWVRRTLQAGDVVVYENDLPDHYP